ncbi:ribonucleotide reductase large subunit [Paraconexibacter sp. AEG42_29]|uniref:Dihydrolipoyl dehydrogenase n=1 Tax=Paraconexibacter sp. AEG42_29 TaxID=2997339 RepID=A0AAU7ARW5_9ACTN
MATTVTVPVPDIGDFDDVPVVEVLVAPGDTVAKEDSLVVLESEKATMEVPSPAAGKVIEVMVKVGDAVKEGVPLLTLEVADSAGDRTGETSSAAGTPPSASARSSLALPDDAPEGMPTAPASASVASDRALPDPSALPEADVSAQLVVLGSGPGGYTAAFRAADLGLDVLMIERYEQLGGVCLNVGCIPSKALLHTAKLITDAETSGEHGVAFAAPDIDLDKLREFKDGVVGKLVGGLSGMAKQRKVRTVHGVAEFRGPNLIAVQTSGGEQTIAFEQCIIAAGSEAVKLPDLPDDERIMDSTGALELRDIPGSLLIVGGGIIGLEMATVYDALGSQVTVVELADVLIPGADQDLVRPLKKRIEKRYAGIHLGTRVEAISAEDDGLHVRFAGKETPATTTFDRVIIAVGRRPNGKAIKAGKAGVEVDDRGFIPVDAKLRTNVPHISAIGDVVPGPMLAHKAIHEGKTAAEVIAGEDVVFDAKTIPSVAYTDPEVAWMGLTETEAKAQDIPHETASFPWAASGRALSFGRSEGATKLIVEPETHRILGAGAVGVHAGDLIAEAVLALEMGAVAGDLALTVHPHPTLSETMGLAADLIEGTITDLPQPRKRAPK